MIKKIFIAIFVAVMLLNNTVDVSAAHKKETESCLTAEPNGHCGAGLICQPTAVDPKTGSCETSDVSKSFGTIKPPPELLPFTAPDPTGKAGISKFLSNLVALFYGLAGIVLIFMLLWGAWDWMTSEGDKEKLDSARKKIINAIVGIILFAVAFAIIQVLGQFTGFQFFAGQKP